MGKIGDLWVRLGLKSQDFEKGIEKSKSTIKSFASSATAELGRIVAGFASITAAIKVVGNSVKTLATFERATSTLASVLGTTKSQITDLSESAMDLGRTTEFTSTNVVELQTELARLGFVAEQIKDMQEPILKFASAVGTDLASAAAFSGSALRAFGLDASQTTTLLDIMAKSTSASALDFSKLQTSIGIVAPIANAFGLDAKQTAAFLGVLANNGFDASSAATALRNILLNLADSNGKLSQGIGHSAKNFEEVIDAFKELSAKGIDVNSVLQMTDKRSAAAAQTIIASADAVKELEAQLSNATGSLEGMYKEMTDNLIGATRALSSAWEGLVLQLGAVEGIKSAVQWLTELLNKWTEFDKKLNGYETSADKDFDKALLKRFTDVADTEGREAMLQMYDKWLRQAEAAEDEAMDKFNARKSRKNKKAMQEAGEYVLALKNIYQQVQNYGVETPSAGTPATPPAPTYTAPLSDEGKKRLAEAKKRADDARKAIEDSFKTDKQLLEQKYGELRKVYEQNGWDTLPVDLRLSLDLQAIDDSKLDDAITRAFEKADEAAKKMGDIVEKDLQAEIDAISNILASEEPFQLADQLTEELLGKTIDMESLIAPVLNSIAQGFSDSMQEMFDAVIGLQDIDGSALFSSLLKPLAQTVKGMGELLIVTGIGMKSFQEIFKNPFLTIAAGAAMVALGAAATAGLNAMAQNVGHGAAAATPVSAGSYGGGTTTGGIETSEMVIRVEGVVKGGDILIAGEHQANEWSK